ncbi:MAG TPA: outer membrane beta-barrel protein [Gammaproteobacteria bacterium]|jgi:opacity protein-like surface antigen|nr:outer membrane beta-barrel protein [Gammaproteobacteria bacterium]
MKKLVLASAMLAATVGMTAVNASPYVGASVGVNVNTSTNTVGGNPGVFRGVPVKLFAGYGSVLSQSFYLAGEFFATLGTAEISTSNLMKTSYGFGISALPGLMLNDNTMAYVRAGLVRSRFSSVNSMVTGGQLGLGLQTSVTQNMDLRGEYTYTDYKNVGTINSPRTDEYTLGLVYKID